MLWYVKRNNCRKIMLTIQQKYALRRNMTKQGHDWSFKILLGPQQK